MLPRRGRAGRELLKCWFEILRKGHQLLILISKGYFFSGTGFLSVLPECQNFDPHPPIHHHGLSTGQGFVKQKQKIKGRFCLSGLVRGHLKAVLMFTLQGTKCQNYNRPSNTHMSESEHLGRHRSSHIWRLDRSEL